MKRKSKYGNIDEEKYKELCDFLRNEDDGITNEELDLFEHIQKLFGPLSEDEG